MIEADIGSIPELILRYLIIVLGAFFMTLAVQSPEIAIWLAGFIFVNGYYSWRLSKMHAPVSRGQYVSLCALLIVSVTLYTTCAVYLFHRGSIAFQTISLCALAAQAMFNLSRHRRGSFVCIYDTLLVSSAGLYLGISCIDPMTDNLAEKLIILLSTTGVSAYYLIATYRNVTLHQRLRDARSTAIQTQKMRAVGQLTAGVAHDFNNLLTVIRGNIELAEVSQSRDDHDLSLQEAKNAADRATRLTGQLLAFSRKAPLTAEYVAMDQFWASFHIILARTLPASVKIEIAPSPNLPHLYCDPNQLENALLNLVINARDAMDERGMIRLTSRPATPEHVKMVNLNPKHTSRYGLIEVVDNGPGIPPDYISQVTEPFFTTKPPGEGSGLGLSMVKGFSEQSGGGFAIVSNITGTKVCLILPTDPA